MSSFYLTKELFNPDEVPGIIDKALSDSSYYPFDFKEGYKFKEEDFSCFTNIKKGLESNQVLSYEQDPFDKNSFFVFFQDQKECAFKIYNDGGHYIGTLLKSSGKGKLRDNSLKLLDLVFNELYSYAIRHINFNRVKKKIKDSNLCNFIKTNISKIFGNFDGLEDYVVKNLEIKFHNYFSRLKRFKRKVYLNKWNYFTTITYDGNKFSEEIFKKKLKKCLSNLHTRHGWRYMGVWERGSETDRLHFHAFMYIPEGEMVGNIEKKRDYSTAKHKMQTAYINSFFKEKFGRNDFQYIKSEEMKAGLVVNYIIKYISKTEERIIFSRGIPTEICKSITVENISCFYEDFCLKFVFYDDILDWEEDIAHYTYEQVSLF